ncbi:MAG: hypothetical protein IT254_00705 [Chitinophagaceae bacterium]|nr:hypothetical protein [Bacteroidota bacterium]MCC6256818.1 hypothetical protein [Chitinophagaceae bacterium]MCW5916026.1 hypothetical protein [Ferruginibacter sp.]
MKKLLHKCALLLLIFSSISFQKIFSQSRVDVGKSFANLSKISTGGTFKPGDTIEVRVTIAVLNQSTPTIIDNVQVFDQVPAKTTYIPGSMRVATNEGVTYRGNFTDASDGDEGTKSGNNITINLGKGANGSTGGRIKSDSSRPSFYNSSCIMMACYRVKINTTVSYGDTLLFGGHIKYRMVTPASGFTDFYFDSTKILIYQQQNFCSNGRSISAASDHNGTFGNGNTQNRGPALAFSTTYSKVNISNNKPNDYYYAIVNNSSATGAINPNLSVPNAARVFSVWDIGGDHTNAIIKKDGNLPAAPGTNGGYFVLVNASYNTNVGYQETLTNLCPNTYYEFTAWFRNVCPRCGCDSTGKGAGTVGYKPGKGNDSAGVKPNLTFEIDGLAYYTTGDIPYSRTVPWNRFGFSFTTRPGQTSAKFAIRNNSPGGGGNDWAIDDIDIVHCGPSLNMNYNPFVLGCSSAPFVVSLVDTIRYIHPNSYIYYKWQRSNVGGSVWTDIPGASGVGSTTFVSGLYQFIVSLPSFLATYSDSGTYYRVITATSVANLSNNCAYNDQSQTMIKVIDCGTVLASGLRQFKGRLVQGKALLTWEIETEEPIAQYEIEKSYDGSWFEKISSTLPRNAENSIYSYTDPQPVEGNVYYRLRMALKNGNFQYSNVVVLSYKSKLEISGLNNPFQRSLHFDVIAPAKGMLTLNLFNDKGQLCTSRQVNILQPGIQAVEINTQNCTNGFYVLVATMNQETIKKKLIKVAP